MASVFAVLNIHYSCISPAKHLRHYFLQCVQLNMHIELCPAIITVLSVFLNKFNLLRPSRPVGLLEEGISIIMLSTVSIMF